jgi:hypothetical protein
LNSTTGKSIFPFGDPGHWIKENTLVSGIFPTQSNLPKANSYSFDASYRVVEDISLSKGGFAYVHSTMTIFEDRLFVGWSKRSQCKLPRVRVERFSITWKAGGSDATGN